MTPSEMLMLRVEASETLRVALGKLITELRGALTEEERLEVASLRLQIAIALRRAARAAS